MTSRFISLRWKLLTLLSAMFFLIAVGIAWVAYEQEDLQLQRGRDNYHRQSVEYLTTEVLTIQQQLVKQLEYLVLLVQDTDQALTPLQLQQRLARYSSYAQLLWGLDQLEAHAQQHGVLLRRGGRDLLLTELNKQAIREEIPVVKLSCNPDCRVLAAAPILLADGETGSLGLATSFADLVLRAHSRSGWDTGVLVDAVHPEEASLPAWQLKIAALSNREKSQPLLQAFARRHQLSGAGTYHLKSDGIDYELSLLPLEDLTEGQRAYWVQLADVSEEYRSIKKGFVSLLLMLWSTLLVSGLVLAILLQRPLSRLALIAKTFPLLAKHDFQKVRALLQLERRGQGAGGADELTLLANSTIELTDELDHLNDEMRKHNQSLQRSRQELARQRDFVTGLLDNAQAIILVQDSSGRCRSINQFGHDLIDCKESGNGPGCHRYFYEIVPGLNDENRHQLAQLYQGSRQIYRHESPCVDQKGRSHMLSWIHSRLTQQDQSNNILSIGMDVTEQMEVQKQLRWLATHDPLTRLPNRHHLHSKLESAVARAKDEHQPIAMLFCDLDNFKQINDTLGHPAGDTLLSQVSKRLIELVRQQDTVARLGGDEFVVLLEYIAQPSDAMQIADKLLNCFERPFNIQDQELYVTASIGIALYPEHGNDPTTLIKHADTAMYQSKLRGRKQYAIYSPELSQGFQERLSLSSSLRHAINRDELLLYYQPQFAIDGQTIVGVEALIRWQHPEHGMVPPDQFIPIAEESGQIIEIGLWVIEEACKQLKRWERQGIANVRMAVNLAGPQIMSDRLLSDTRCLLEEHRLEAARFEFEITETFIMSQPESTIARLQQLRDLGLRLSIDDFGTGYSSLSYLKRLPIDKLKIDKSFVFDIGHDKDDEAIARAVIALGQSLSLKVIAEGVEEQGHVDFLRANGCDELQGFYFSRPLPANECAKFLRKHQCVLEINRQAKLFESTGD